MARLILAALLVALQAAPAFAQQCRVERYVLNGRIVTCVVCPNVTNCH